MPSFNFTSQRPIALTAEGLQVEFTEGVDIAVPIPADQVTVAPIAGITGTDAQAVLAELAGDDSTHAAGTGVHTIAGVTGLQTALDGKSPTGHNHDGIYELAGAVSAHAAGTGVHTIAGVNGLQAALDGAVKLSPAGGATQAIGGLLTLQGAYPALVFDTLTLYLSPTGSPTPADPLGGDAFSTWYSLVTYVNARLIVAKLTLNVAPGTYVETATFSLTNTACSAVTIESSGTVVIDGSGITPATSVWATCFQGVTITCPMTISCATRVWSHNMGQLSIQAPVTMTSLALAAAGTLRINSLATLGIQNATLTLVQPAGVGICLYAAGTDHFVSGATASLIVNKASNNEAITIYSGIFRLVSGGTISTPGLGKAILVGAIVNYTIPAANLLNGATLTQQMASFEINGWWKDPATGLILQWGDGVTDATGVVVQTLPIAFPTTHLSVAVSSRVATTVSVLTTSARTTTGFTVNSYKVTDGLAMPSVSFTFIATGY